MDNKNLDKVIGAIGAGVGSGFLFGGACAVFCDSTGLIGTFAIVGFIFGFLFQLNVSK